MATVNIQREIGPGQFTSDDCRFQRLAVKSRRPFDVPESRREAIDNVHILQGDAKCIADCNDVRNQLAASHV